MHAALDCLCIGIAYVAPFYLKRNHARSHPSTIKFRMASTAATCLVAWMPLCWQLQKKATSAHGLLLPLLGLRSKGLLQAVIQPLLLTASLFMGPLLQTALSGRPDGDSIVQLQTLRNLVMAPITEEFCFRACMAPLFLLQGYSKKQTVFLTPVMFGVAHVHHLVEMVKFQGAKLLSATAAVAFQFLYTTVFGWYATHIFLSTGHLAGAVTVHAFCNWIGFPAIFDIASHPRKNTLIAAYLVGIITFISLFGSCSDPERYSCTYDQLISSAEML